MEHSMLDLAAAQGHCDAIRILLARGADVNAATPAGRTALHCAAYQDQAAAVDTLVIYGARIEAADHEGCTALHVASANGASNAIISLLRHGAAKTKLNKCGRSPLLLAVENGRLFAATLLLHASEAEEEEEEEEEGFVDRRYGNDEYSALDLAARAGQAAVSQMIIRHGADVNAQDSDGVSALYLAALNDRAVMIDILVNAGADVQAKARGRQSRTALHIACAEGSSRAVEALLKCGAGLFTRDIDHRTPLHLAARNGDVMTVKILLAWGSDPSFCSVSHEYNFTALDEASYRGHVDVVRAMCNCAPVNKRGKGSTRDIFETIRKRDLSNAISSALSIAAKRNEAGVIDVLVKAGGDVNEDRGVCGPPILYAAESGAEDAIAALARHGANINKLGGLGHVVGLNKFKGKRRSALHIVALFGWVRAAGALLTFRANPHLRCPYGDQHHYRPLDIASEEGHVEIMRLMIKHGVNVDDADLREGLTALHVAAASDRVEAIGVLTKAGCSLDLADRSGGTPLHACVVNNSCAAIAALATTGADLNKANAEGNTPLHVASSSPSRLGAVKALLTAGVDTGARNNEDTSALDLAAKAGHVAVLQALIEGGADVNSEDGEGRTALIRAVKANRASAVDVLLSAGADAEARLHGESWTSLHAAAEDTQAEVVHVLLKHGANVHAKDAENDNDTPLHVAVRQAGMEGAFEIVKALLRHDADEEARNDNELTPVSVVGSMGGPDAARAVTVLLQRAPGDRAWRRRGLLILCCAYAKKTSSAAATITTSPKEEQAQKQAKINDASGMERAGLNAGDVVKGKEHRTPGVAAAAGAHDKFNRVASWLLDLREEGLFRIVVSYL
eukprot:g6768.t1